MCLRFYRISSKNFRTVCEEFIQQKYQIGFLRSQKDNLATSFFTGEDVLSKLNTSCPQDNIGEKS